MADTTKSTPVKNPTLPKDIFGVEVKNHELLRLTYDSYLASSRQASATTKQRGEVRGGGKKPWAQKGTGRARFGSTRNPIWRGGGIVFGPTGGENYTKQMNVKAKRQAIRQALSMAAAANSVIVIEDLVSKTGKTAELAKFLTKIGADKNVLVVVDNKTPELIRASQNLQSVRLVSATFVNVYDCLNADCVVFTQAALKATTDWLSKEAK
jgi:large subunit ribosomal protein L4